MPYIGNKTADTTLVEDNSITSAKIVNDSVIESKLNLISTSSVPSLEAKGTSGVTEGYIQLNCAENSHGIKLKSPPHSAGASYTLTFPNNDGDANQFLQTNGSGVLSFADAGGTLVLLQTTTISSLTGNVDFNNVFDSTYKNYVVIGSQIRGDVNSKILCRFGTGSTPTFDSTSNYHRVVSYISAIGSDSIKSSTSDNAVLVTPNTIKYDDGDASFIMYFPEPQNTNRQLLVHFSGVEYDTNPAVTHFDGGGKCNNIGASTPITSVRFTPNAGSGFNSGTFKLYGVK